MLVRAKGSSHQPGSVLSGWRWLFKKFPHGIFRQRCQRRDVATFLDIGTKLIVKSNNFITGRHFPTVPQPSPCVCKDFPCYWFFFLFLFSQLCAGKSQRERETRCWPTRGRLRERERASGNHHHRQLPRLNYGYFEWTGCKRTGHTHQ